jgi:hypothetical protein
MTDLHIHQYYILRELTFCQSATFAELNTEKYSTDHHAYHLNSLIKSGHIKKSESLEYSLTVKGKSLAAELSIELPRTKPQSKLHISFVCHRSINGIDEYVFHKRKKHPFLGWVGFPSAKLDLNSFLMENASRKLYSELGLKGRLELKGIHHILVRLNENAEIVEDKFFYIVIVSNVEEELLEDNHDGKNHWSPLPDKKSELVFPDINKYAGLINTKGIEFWEETQFYKDL